MTEFNPAALSLPAATLLLHMWAPVKAQRSERAVLCLEIKKLQAALLGG